MIAKYNVTKRNKALILYGMALHTATDTFAHSSYVNGRRITHGDNNNDGIADADHKEYCSNRYHCAKIVAKQTLAHVSNGERGKVADWVISSDIYKNNFKFICFSKFAKAVNASVYNSNKSNFDNMNLNVENITNY